MACDGLCMYRYHHIGINIYSFVFLFYSIYSPVYAPPTNRWYFYFIIIYWWSVSFDIGMEWRSAMRSSSRVTSEIRRKKIWNEWWTCAFQREHEIQYIKYSCQYSIHDSQCNSWMSVGNAYCCCCCRMEKKNSTNDFAPNTTTVTVYTLRIDLSICTQLTFLSLRKMFASFIFRAFELPQNWTAAFFSLLVRDCLILLKHCHTTDFRFLYLVLCKVFFDIHSMLLNLIERIKTSAIKIGGFFFAVYNSMQKKNVNCYITISHTIRIDQKYLVILFIFENLEIKRVRI